MAIILGVLLLLAGVAIYAVVAAVPMWLLWNALMPSLFNLPHVSFWQAFGLLLLPGFLFRSGGSSSSSNSK